MRNLSGIANGWMNHMSMGLTGTLIIPAINNSGVLTEAYARPDSVAQAAGSFASAMPLSVGKSAQLFPSGVEKGYVEVGLHTPIDIGGTFFARNTASFRSIMGRTADGTWHTGISTKKESVGFVGNKVYHFGVEASALSHGTNERDERVIKAIKAGVFNDDGQWKPVHLTAGVHWRTEKFQIDRQLRGDHQRMSIAILEPDEALIQSLHLALKMLDGLLSQCDVENVASKILDNLEAGLDLSHKIALEYGSEIAVEAKTDGTFVISQEWPGQDATVLSPVFESLLYPIAIFTYNSDVTLRRALPLVFGSDALERIEAYRDATLNA